MLPTIRAAADDAPGDDRLITGAASYVTHGRAAGQAVGLCGAGVKREGGDDRCLAKSEDIAARIPGSRLEVFESSGHMPMVEENEKFISLLRFFLESSPSPVAAG